MKNEKNFDLNNLTSPFNKAKFFYHFFNLKKVESKKEREVFTNIWYKIWLKEGYAQPNENILEEKKKYEKVSEDFLIKFLWIPIGTIRIIHHNREFGLPVLNNFEIQKNFQEEKIVELSLFSIKENYRFSHLTNLITIKKIYKILKKESVSGFLAALDERLFHLLKEKFQIPLQQIGREKIYEGSLTYPVYLNLREGEEFLRNNNIAFFNFISK